MATTLSAKQQVLLCPDLFEQIIDWTWALAASARLAPTDGTHVKEKSSCTASPPIFILSLEFVHKSWLPRSRYHRFRNVILTPRSTPGFLELLASPGESVSPYVESVQFEDEVGSTFRNFRSTSSHVSLPNVKTLCFHQLASFPFSSNQNFTAFGTIFPSVHTLRFRLCLGIEAKEIFALMNELPSVDNLDFDSEAIFRSGVERIDDFASVTRLRSLTARCTIPRFPWDLPYQWGPVLRLIVESGRLLNLESLTLEGFTPEELESTERLLEKSKGTLREVNLSFSEDHSCEDVWRRGRRGRVDIDTLLRTLFPLPFLSLRRLRIKTWIPFESSIHAAAVRSLPTIIRHILSPNLEQLELDVNLSGCEVPVGASSATTSMISSTANSPSFDREFCAILMQVNTLLSSPDSQTWNLRKVKIVVEDWSVEKEASWCRFLGRLLEDWEAAEVIGRRGC